MRDRSAGRSVAASLFTAGLLLLAGYAGFFQIGRWASRSFARPTFASMLVAVIEVGVFVAFLCAAPFVSMIARRLLGRVGPVAESSTPATSFVRFVLAASIATTAIYLSDVCAWLLVVSEASRSTRPSSALVGLLVSAMCGMVGGSGLWLMAWMATRPGPAASWTLRPIVSRARSLGGLFGGIVLFPLPLVAAVPLRARLLEDHWASAAIDLGALVLALGAFVAGGWLGNRFGPKRATPWRALGVMAAILGLAAAVVAGALRPPLASSGLLDIVLVGIASLLGAAAFVLLPPLSPRWSRWAVAAIGIFGLVATVGAERAAGLRSGPPTEVRPSRWLLVDLTSRVDFDRDGYSPFFDQDCDDFDPYRNPDAPEIPGNGVDDNCRGGDRLIAFPWPRRASFVPLPATVRQPKRILLLVVDSLRADRLSVYGYSKNTSPNIDRLARRSVLFRRAYSGSPLTRFAIPMLMTGRLLPEILWNLATHPPGIRPENTTVAEVLRGAGFRTAAFVTVYALTRRWGITQGFEHVDDSLAHPPSELYGQTTSDGLVDRALRWIETHREDRWFVWMHFLDPHSSYVPHEGIPAFGTDRSGLYDGEVRFTDREIGRLLDRMRALGLDDDTAIVLLADHGEMLGEHGAQTHGGVMWEEVLRIPMIVHVPGIPAGQVDCVTAHQDVASTILNLAGIDGGRQGLTSSTLVPDLIGRCDPDREMIAEMGDSRVIVGPTDKLVFNTRLRTSQLYDLSRDPQEQHNLAEERPEVAARMRQRLAAWEEYRASRQVGDTLARSVVSRVPRSATRLDARFENGVEFLAADLGNRRMDVDHPLRIALYIRATRRVREFCRVNVHFKHGKRAARLRGLGLHEPASGILPFPFFPPGRIVEDLFHLRWRGRSGEMTGKVALWCEGRHMGAQPGPHVGRRGWVDLGTLRVAKKERPKGTKSRRESTRAE